MSVDKYSLISRFLRADKPAWASPLDCLIITRLLTRGGPELQANISHGTLAVETGASISAVQQSLNRLCDAGWLVRTGNCKSGRAKTYTPQVEALPIASDLSDKDSANGVAGLDASAFLKSAEFNLTLNAQTGTTYTFVAAELGGVQSFAAQASKWINAISTAGVPSATQPASTDLSDVSSLVTLTGTQTITNKTVGSGGLAGLTPSFQKFTASGTFTIPTGVKAVKVTVLGGGGAGGGSTSSNNGGGGGSGAAAIKWLSGLTPGNTLTVTVGSGGTGVSGAGGNSGTASSVASGTQTITTITGGGGAGGNGNGSQSSGGGGGSASNGDLNFSGNTGNDGFGVTGGAGAGSMFGGGSTNSNGGNPGVSASSPGGGGGGAGAGASRSGGSGGSGLVFFEYMI